MNDNNLHGSIYQTLVSSDRSSRVIGTEMVWICTFMIFPLMNNRRQMAARQTKGNSVFIIDSIHQEWGSKSNVKHPSTTDEGERIYKVGKRNDAVPFWTVSSSLFDRFPFSISDSKSAAIEVDNRTWQFVFYIYIFEEIWRHEGLAPAQYNKQMNYKKIRRTNYRAFVAGPTPAIPYNIRTTVYIVLQLYIKNINGRLKLLAVYSE
jgi:hypothetical protein